MVEGNYVEIDGRDLYYEKSGTGPILLCLHTAGTDGRVWRHFSKIMSSRYTVLVPDLPGHGKSSPWEGWRTTRITVDYYSQAIGKFMAELDLNDVHLLGCSIGADIALSLSLTEQNRVKNSIIAEGAGKTNTFRDEEILLTDPYSVERAFNFCGSRSRKENIEQLLWIRTSNNRDIYISDLLAWNHFDIMSSLKNIRIPLTLLRGKEDPVVTSDMLKDTARLIPSSRISELDGFGHYPMVEDPESFADVIQGILSV